MITALVVFIITCFFFGLRQITRLRINRPVDALILAMTIVIGILVLTGDTNSANSAETIAQEKPNQQLSITVVSSSATSKLRAFRVPLICDTDASRIKGLQGFRELTKNEAALFVFEEPLIVSFWMGSVAYPIDIIFVNPEGKVVRVYPNCKPGSLDRYPSFERVTWVIETAAGSNIRAGDRVSIEGPRIQGKGKKQ